MKVKDIVKVLDQWCPPNLAYEWDNVGLLVGDRSQEVRKVYISLDVTDQAIEMAKAAHADMIITHHPLLFQSVKKIHTDDFITNRVIQLLKNDIASYAMHTNYDICRMADVSGKYLELTNQRSLEIEHTEKVYKVAVYVPVDHEEEVAKGMADAGAGAIGEYSDCSFRIQGEGTFKPLPGTHPFIGTIGEMERVNEVKIETVVSESNLNKVLETMVNIHPYEEPAYDVYELKKEVNPKGIGKIGQLPKKMTLKDTALYVKEKFSLESVRVYGNLDEILETVAILPGSGKSYIDSVLRTKATGYITGDITHHDGIDAVARGLNIIDAGHYGIEHIFIEDVKNKLMESFEGLEVLTEKISHPFQVL
ncbi:MAG TPA: Nif3-like dinuclear metal center hexameric protein [Candidatus Merdenecus merdavium]|nr:Nif3-like dinuclear metal center hexameric protein [Candidatus Merdenecus merdavium]